MTYFFFDKTYQKNIIDYDLLERLYFQLTDNSSVETINSNLADSSTEVYTKNGEYINYPSVLNYQYSDGSLPLHLAIKNNCSDDIIIMLIEKFPNAVDHQDNNGSTPLHLLLNNNNVSIEIINFILDNSRPRKYKYENEEYPSVLDNKDNNKLLPLHCSIKYNCSINIITILINRYPNALWYEDINGHLPLHLSVLYYSENILKFLLEEYHAYNNNISVDHQDNDGMTVLHHFLNNKKIHEQHENEIEMHNNKIENIIEIINSILNNSTTTFESKFNQEIQSILNIKDKYGFIPFHYAIINNCSFEVLDLLIDLFSASFFAKNNNGETIYHIDAKHNKSNFNALHIYNETEFLDEDVEKERHLLSKCVDNDGKTYFHYIMEHNLDIQSIYNLLYSDDMSVLDIKDNNGLLPIDYARNNKSSQNIIDLLAANSGLDYSDKNLFLIKALKNKESEDKIISLINKESVRTFSQISGETAGSPLLCALENGYSLDIIKRLVDEFPQSIMGIRKYFSSDTACHTALYANCSNDILSFILDKYPILCSIKCEGDLIDEGDLPIDIAFEDNVNNSLENIKLLLKIHPIKDGNHFLHNARDNTLEIFEFVLNNYPESAKYKVNGTLPIHRICIRDANILKKIKLLLKKYPEGAKEKDIDGRLPIEIYARDYRYYEMGNNPNLQQVLSYKYKVLCCLYEANLSKEARNCLTVAELKICDKIRQGAAMVAIESIKQSQPHVNEKILRKNADMFENIKSFI